MERTIGDRLRDEWKRQYDPLLPEIQPATGAHALLEQLRGEGRRSVPRDIRRAEHTEHYIDLLDVRGLLDGSTTAIMSRRRSRRLTS